MWVRLGGDCWSLLHVIFAGTAWLGLEDPRYLTYMSGASVAPFAPTGRLYSGTLRKQKPKLPRPAPGGMPLLLHSIGQSQPDSRREEIDSTMDEKGMIHVNRDGWFQAGKICWSRGRQIIAVGIIE